MTDKDLLERAARAAGYEVHEGTDGTMQARPVLMMWHYVMGQAYTEVEWNPLRESGQAHDLAVKRKIFRCHMDLFHAFYEEERANGLDEYAATRRAIVRAAAEMAT